MHSDEARVWRKHQVRFLTILRNGYFVKFDYVDIARYNEPETKLWRAVIDQHLKDIIEHHLVKDNALRYSDSVSWVNTDNQGLILVSDLASLPCDLVRQVFAKINSIASAMSRDGVIL